MNIQSTMNDTHKTLRTEAEWKVQGRFVKQKATPVMRCQRTGEALFAKFQTFTNGDHPYHVPNYIGDET